MRRGQETEAAAVDLYEAAGYQVWTPPKAKYRAQDVFGLFDLMAFGHDRLEGVQVKTSKGRGITQWCEEARPFEEHVEDFRVRFVVLYPDEGWRLYELDEDSYTCVCDGREIDETPAPVLVDEVKA